MCIVQTNQTSLSTQLNMIKLKIISFLLCLFGSSLVSCKSPPVFSKTYSVAGTLSIPYAELREPFIVWYDGEQHRSRIDYYGGMVKTYQLSKLGQYGTSVKIAPVTTETIKNVETCFATDGSYSAPISPQSMLPNLTNFKLVGSEEMEGYLCEKWKEVVSVDERTSEYTMWLRYKKTAKSPLLAEPVPVKYEMRGFNSLLGSHYDHYYLTYTTYSSNIPSADLFTIREGFNCTGFGDLGSGYVHTFNPMKEFVDRHTDHVDEAWEDFKSSHSKTYDSHKEHTQRKDIFRQNLRYIHSTNRKGLSYNLKVNHLADKSDKEMRAMRGRQYKPGYNGGNEFPYSLQLVQELSQTLPDNFDWRILGAVTPVKDQSVCGSCWSFGTTGAMEGAYFVKTGHLLSFSQQSLVDCSWGFGNNGCDGGLDHQAYQWIMKHGGIPTQNEYGPYYGADGYCHTDSTKLHAPITGYVNVTSSDEQALRLAMFKHGPISVAIDASHRTFSFYNNGVYFESECKNAPEDLDHSVLAVGYGTLNGENYWLIKNSWSNYWGNQGYVLMSSKNNNCGVMTVPTYVTM